MESHEVTDIVRVCSDLLVRYTHFADLGELHRIPELFTHDGIWATPAEEHKGQDALRERFEAMAEEALSIQRVTRHVCSNMLVDVLSPEEATATVYLTLYLRAGPRESPAPNPVPTKIGQYRDRLVKTVEGWRFAERRCSYAFV